MYLAVAYYKFFVEQPAGMILVIVTATVGSFVLFLYRRQMRDQKLIAAQTIYSEISSAENKLKDIRARFFATQTPTVEQNQVMKYESWSRYKHLFLKDLPDEMWNLVDTFYSNCSDYDNAVKLSRDNVEAIIRENYRHQYDFYASKIAAYHEAHPSHKSLPKSVIDDLLIHQGLFLDQKTKGQFDYIPVQAVNTARTALVALDTSVSASKAGQILKRIARL